VADAPDIAEPIDTLSIKETKFLAQYTLGKTIRDLLRLPAYPKRASENPKNARSAGGD